MAMRSLFLGVDGILNSEGSIAGFGGPSRYFGAPDLTCFDTVGLALVRRLCEATGCLVVLASRLRLMYTPEQVGCALNLPLVGATPYLGGARGKEIGAWLALHPEVTHYAIVDDLITDWTAHPQHVARVVPADPHCGISLADYHRLRSLLLPGEPT